MSKVAGRSTIIRETVTLPPMRPGTSRIQESLSLTAAEKKMRALEGFFAGVDIDHVPRYESFARAFHEITGITIHEGWTKNPRLPAGYVLREDSSSTTTWTELLADTVNRVMLRDYREPDQWSQWRLLVSEVSTVKDFRQQSRLRVTGYGDLQTYGEGEPTPALASPDDDEVTYAINKRGGIATVTQEAAVNDDVGALRRIPRSLAQAAKRTQAKSVFNLLRDNVPFKDSVPLAHATHGNLVESALSLSAVTESRFRMRRQSFGGNFDDVIRPKTLVVPVELEELGWRLTSVPLAPTASYTGTEPNFHRRHGLNQLIALPYWTAADQWWIVADPSTTPTIEVAFLEGRTEPRVVIADDEKSGSAFTADKVDLKIQFIWGVCLLDYRGFVGGIP